MSNSIPSDRIQKRIEILALDKQNLPSSDIAKRVGVSLNTVKKWRKSDIIVDQQRTGRPTKVTPTTKEKINNEIKGVMGASVRSCAKALNFSHDYQNRNKSISPTSITRYLQTTDWGKMSFRIISKPLLSEKNIIDRLNFALHVQLIGYTDNNRFGQRLRRNIMFTDESFMLLNSKPNRQNMRIRTESKENVPIVGIPKFPGKIMVAGGITRSGKTPLIIIPPNTNVNGDYYRKYILPIYLESLRDPSLIPEPKYATFMQDGAPCHTSNDTIEMIEDNVSSVWSRGLWPGNSPDINPIEHVWAILQNSLFKEPKPKSINDLISRVRKEWEKLPIGYLEKLIDSFPDRINSVINAEGGSTKY